MTMAGYPNTRAAAYANPFGSVDPAPRMDGERVEALLAVALDESARMFPRMRALFGLRAVATEEPGLAVAAIDALGRALLEPASALLRHEAAYIFGQLQRPEAIGWLDRSIRDDPSPMVRHEASEALGNINDDRIEPLLRRALTADPAPEVRESCEVALDNLAWLRGPDL